MAKTTATATRTEDAKGRTRLNGEGALYRTADGLWRGVVTYKDAGGATRRKSVSAKTAGEAIDKMDRLKADLKSGAPMVSTTVAEFMAAWLPGERELVRASSWTHRAGHVKSYIAPRLGTIALAKLTPADVERMTAGMVASGLSARTAAHARITLRKALGDAQRDGLVMKNAAALARPPRVTKGEAKFLDQESVKALLAVAATDKEWGPIITVAVTTGLRQGELLGLCLGLR